MVGSASNVRARRSGIGMSAALVVLVLLGLGLPALPADAAASAPIPDLQCGQPITTSVKLRADLTCIDPLTIPIGTPPVTVDLGGHTLSGPPVCNTEAGYNCALVDGSGQASIIDGTIRGSVASGDSMRSTRLWRVHVTGSVTTGHGGRIELRHTVVDNGVYQYAAASIHDSTITGGIYVDDTFVNLRFDIVGNTIIGGVRPGIDIAVRFDFDHVGGRIERNQIRGSTGPGIQIRGRTFSMSRTTIANNTVVDNSGDGISVMIGGASLGDSVPRDTGPITVSGNVARRNAGRGIVVGTATGPHPGVVDGGGNRARDNAVGPQCLGIRCASTIDPRLVPDLEWHNKGPMEYGVPLGPDQLDATSSVPGSFIYTPAAGAVPRVRESTLSVHFVPTDLVHYQPVDRSVDLWVDPPARMPPTITWADPAPMLYGQPLGPDQLNATASVPGQFTYTPIAGTVLPVGSYRIEAQFVPDDRLFYFDGSATVTISVLPGDGAAAFATPVDLGGPPQDAPIDVDLADVNGDRLDDLVTVGAGVAGFGGRIRVALGAGDGTVPTATDRATVLGDGGHQVAIGDVDADGHPDLVATSSNAQTVSVLLGVGDGTFARKVDYPGGSGLGDVQLVDLDGDGDLDIVESNFQTPTVSVLRGHGDGTFEAKVDYPVGLGPLRLTLVDLDGDDLLDVVVPNALGNTISVLIGRGDGTFEPVRNVAVGSGPTGAVALDVDHDGDDDVAVSNAEAATVTLLTNDGSGGLSRRAVHPAAVGVGQLTVADMNGDGEADVVFGARSGSVGILAGSGSALRPAVVYSARPNVQALGIGDLDGDGRPDIVVGCGLASGTALLLNRTHPPPS